MYLRSTKRPMLEILEDRHAPGSLMSLVDMMPAAQLSLVKTPAKPQTPIVASPSKSKPRQAPALVQPSQPVETRNVDLLFSPIRPTTPTQPIAIETTALSATPGATYQVFQPWFSDSTLTTADTGTSPIVSANMGSPMQLSANANPLRLLDSTTINEPVEQAADSVEAPTVETPAPAAITMRNPLSFEQNVGQVENGGDFVARGKGYLLSLEANSATLVLRPPGGQQGDEVLNMAVVGGNAAAVGVASELQTSVSNYFIGQDASQWHTNVARFSRVTYDDVYTGVDLTYYGSQDQRLEYDFIVQPGADASVIELQFTGARDVSLDVEGNLVLAMEQENLVQHAPVVYQLSASGIREAVDANYVLLGNGKVGFELGEYDSSRTLVIDPVVSYSTYLGGSADEIAYGVSHDSSGNAYVVGWTASSSIPAITGSGTHYDSTLAGNTDAFVVKYSPTGTIVYSTYIGGAGGTNPLDGVPSFGVEMGYSIAVDSEGCAYITGSTTSYDFPLAGGYYQGNLSRATDVWGAGTNAFVTKLNASGNALVYSTYLGRNHHGILNNPVYRGITYTGNSFDFRETSQVGYGIAVDSSFNIYVTGGTSGENHQAVQFGQTPAPFDVVHISDAWVAKIGATGSPNPVTMLWNIAGADGGSNPTDYAAVGTEIGRGIALDSNSNVYLTGVTYSSDYLATIGANQTALSGTSDAYITKLNSTLTATVYSTFLGGPYIDDGRAIAVDSSGNAYVTGQASDINFPTTTGAYQTQGTTLAGFKTKKGNAFVAKLNSTGTGRVYASYLGGLGTNTYGIAVDASGNAWVTGGTSDGLGNGTAGIFPTTAGAPQTTSNGAVNAFLTRFNSTGSALLFSTLHGGDLNMTYDGINRAYGVAIRNDGSSYSAVIVGSTDPTLPTVNAHQSTAGSSLDGFVAKFTGI